MPSIHFLNVGHGDCIIVQHGSGRVTMIDICSGNLPPLQGGLLGIFAQMADRPTKPQEYLRRLGITEIWRFILTHPDMDHLDGFDALLDEFTVHNFWHNGAKREKPPFGAGSRYKEADWDRYERVKGDQDSPYSRLRLAGHAFAHANQTDSAGGGSDGLHILAPTPELISLANETEDPNDGSYVILYRAGPFKIIFAGDSHDATWEHILAHHRADVEGCDVLIAPHHGRDSGRSWDFLGVTRPALTLFGVARSEHLAYDAWNRRDLFKITNNQAGNVVMHMDGNHMDVFVEHDGCAEKHNAGDNARNGLGYRRLGWLDR